MRRLIVSVALGVAVAMLYGGVLWNPVGWQVQGLVAWGLPIDMPGSTFQMTVDALTLGALAVPGIAVAVVAYRRLRGGGDGETRCRACGYILRGLSEPRCPECGERI